MASRWRFQYIWSLFSITFLSLNVIKNDSSGSSQMNGALGFQIPLYQPCGFFHNDIVNLLDNGKALQKGRLEENRWEIKDFESKDESWKNDLPLTGKTAVITGAAGGIGGELVKVIHRLGGTVVALDRDIEGLEQLKRLLTEEGSNLGYDGGLEDSRFWILPTQHEDLDSVSHTANQIKSRFATIDLLVNNAGMTYNSDCTCGDDKMKAKNGKDLLFTVNYLSHFLLTEKLLPNLSKAKGRVVHLTSTYHWKVDGTEIIPSCDEGNPQAYESDPSHQSPRHIERSYANSKLAQIYHSRTINIHSPDCDSVCACPTWAATGIGGEDARDFLGSMAFPIEGSNKGFNVKEHRYGAGISSAINALFRTREELGDALNCGTSFVANSHILEFFVGRRSLLRWPIWRDTLTDLIGFCLLIGQRFTYEDFIIQETSPESHDEDKRNKLYKWSKKEVKEWLHEP